MDREQHENLSEPGREPGDCDDVKNPVSTGSRHNEQKPLFGFVCIFGSSRISVGEMGSEIGV